MICYDFQCNNCGNKFELKTTYNNYLAALIFRCPKCDSANVRRVIGESIPVYFHGDDFTKSIKEAE